MAYIANTAFEVLVSNHEFDSAANITGKYKTADTVLSAGILCKRVALVDNEGYTGLKNHNTWTMEEGAATDILFACNPHNVNEITDPRTGNAYKIGRETLGLPLPANKEDTFTLIRADGVHQYRFGIGNLTAELGDNGFLTVASGRLTPAATAPAEGIYFQVVGTGNFTEGAYNAFGYVDVLALKA